MILDTGELHPLRKHSLTFSTRLFRVVAVFYPHASAILTQSRAFRTGFKPNFLINWAKFFIAVEPQWLICGSLAMCANLPIELIFEKNVVELGLKDSGENPWWYGASIYKRTLWHQSKIVNRPIGTIAKIKRCQYSSRKLCAGDFPSCISLYAKVEKQSQLRYLLAFVSKKVSERLRRAILLI